MAGFDKKKKMQQKHRSHITIVVDLVFLYTTTTATTIKIPY